MGLEGGLSNNTYQTNIANRAATVLAGATGFNLAFTFRYRISPWLYAAAAPGLVQKGYSMNRTDSLAGEYERYMNTYWQLPIGISLAHDWHRLRGTLDPGLYAGYWLYGRVKGSMADIFSATSNNGAAGQTSEQFQLSSYNKPYSFLSQRDNRWEEGWYLGLGLQFHMSGSGPCWLTASGKYNQSLTTQEKAPDNPIPAYNRTLTFSIGVIWSLDKPKRSI
jgi:outer membrane protein with beta-barrel domain